MFKGILHLHVTSVILFLIIYLIKTLLLVLNKTDKLDAFKSKTKVLEMIISTTFLLSGVYLMFNVPIKTMLIVKIIIVLASIPTAVVAYKKSNKILAVISLLMIVMAYGLAEMSKKPTVASSKLNDADNNLSNEEFAVKYGPELYKSECNQCHGENGNLGISGAFDLSKSTLTKEEAIQVITMGRGNMYGYKDLYSEKQINAVAVYIQSLRK